MFPDRSVSVAKKLVENAKIQMGHFELFSNDVAVVSIKKDLPDKDPRYKFPW